MIRCRILFFESAFGAFGLFTLWSLLCIVESACGNFVGRWAEMLDFIGMSDMEYFLPINCSFGLSLSSLAKRLFRRTMSIVDPFSAFFSIMSFMDNSFVRCLCFF